MSLAVELITQEPTAIPSPPGLPNTRLALSSRDIEEYVILILISTFAIITSPREITLQIWCEHSLFSRILENFFKSLVLKPTLGTSEKYS